MLLHRITTLVIVTASLSQPICQVYSDDLEDKPGRPNIVLILADDLGYGDLGCYGHPKFKTPKIDELARSGIRLTQFYVPIPYCAPSRASLMTGRYPFRCGLSANPHPATDAVVHNNDLLGLPVTETTLADVLRAAGYRTACFGKWHLGHQPQFRPLRRGFDEYFGLLYSNDMHPVELYDADQRVEYPVVQATLTRRLTERAVAFLEKHRAQPFFLYLPHVAPHKPLFASEEYYQKSGSGLYGDALAELDHAVGAVLSKLKDLGLAENTLVLLTSDNGPWYGGSTGGLRGMKGQTWEGGIRVPMIACWPGRIPAGQVSVEPAIMMDLFPTILAAAGVAPPAGVTLDGQNLLPVFTSNAKSPHEDLYSFSGERLCSVREGRWKLHVSQPGPLSPKIWKADEAYVDPRHPDGVRILAPYEQPHPSLHPGVLAGDVVKELGLFDLESDPAEQHDISREHPEIVARLRAKAETMSSLVRRLRGNP